MQDCKSSLKEWLRMVEFVTYKWENTLETGSGFFDMGIHFKIRTNFKRQNSSAVRGFFYL